MADEFRRALDKVGKGGVKCDCCNPYSSRRSKKHKAKLSRLIRHRLKNNKNTLDNE